MALAAQVYQGEESLLLNALTEEKKKRKVYLLVCKLIKLTVHNISLISTSCVWCEGGLCVFTSMHSFVQLLSPFLISEIINQGDDMPWTVLG